MAPEKYSLSIKEAQLATSLGRDTIMAAVKRGEIDHIKVGLKGLGQGRRILIPVQSLKAWITSQESK